MYILHLGKFFIGDLGSGGLKVVHNSLEGLVQPKLFYDSSSGFLQDALLVKMEYAKLLRVS